VEIYLIAEFDHDSPSFSVRNNQEGHAFVKRIKDLFKEISMDRKIKFLLKKGEAEQSEDPEKKIPELKELIINNKIINSLTDSLEENIGKIELKVVNTKTKGK
jgi:hypothetical protein|tara:strand:+ start:899 stop:1207 length:309 start_codon:yes stop_codon:yes gene_type:complete